MPFIKTEIENIIMDRGIPILLLKDKETNGYLQISIGPLEAQMIAYGLLGKKLQRPGLHDLMVNILSELSYKVESIEVYDLKENIYYANINLTDNGRRLKIDSRPSDAIALALRTNSPIFVEKKLFMTIDKVKFRKPVVPGDQIVFEVMPLRTGSKVWKLEGKAFVDGSLVAGAEFMAQIG